MFTRINIDESAVKAMEHGPEGVRAVKAAGRVVRDEARVGARAVSNKTGAIVMEVDADERSVFARVGYKKRHPGFFLWWWEVGTVNHGPRPHLRPALRAGIL